MKYNLENLKEVSGVKGLYIPSEEQKEDVIKDVLGIHFFLKQAHKLAKGFPELCFMREEIQFYDKKIHSTGGTLFCNFQEQKQTPSGKRPKYLTKLSYIVGTPLISNYGIGNLHVLMNTERCFFGQIYYLANGNIGKIDIIIALGDIRYEVNIRQKKGKGLEITTIKEDSVEIYKA